MMRPALIRPGDEGLLAQAIASQDAEPKKCACMFWLSEVADGSQQQLYEVIDGVAIVPVQGVLVDVMSYGGAPWATGYNVLQVQIEHALVNPRVRAIAFDMNSVGGMVDGCFELVEWMHEAKAAAEKPIAAIVNTQAFSAAYAIASAADSISAPATGGVGSIGVVMVHFEYAGAFKAAGITATVIAAGKHKADGNPYQALPDRVEADLSETAEEFRRIFADTVAKGRSGAGLTAKAALATEAYSYARPSKIEEARRLGLIDAVLAPDEALAQLIEAAAH